VRRAEQLSKLIGTPDVLIGLFGSHL